MVLKRGQTVELVTSYLVTQEEGQTPAKRRGATQRGMGTSKDKGTHIGGASVSEADKAG